MHLTSCILYFLMKLYEIHTSLLTFGMVIIPIVSKGLGPSYCLLSLSPSFNDNLHMSTSLLHLQQTQNHVYCTYVVT